MVVFRKKGRAVFVADTLLPHPSVNYYYGDSVDPIVRLDYYDEDHLFKSMEGGDWYVYIGLLEEVMADPMRKETILSIHNIPHADNNLGTSYNPTKVVLDGARYAKIFKTTTDLLK